MQAEQLDMPFLHSPRRTSSPASASNLHTIEPTENEPALPPHTPHPSQSAASRASAEACAMVPTIHVPSAVSDHKDPPIGLSVDEPTHMHWATSNHLPMYQMASDDAHFNNVQMPFSTLSGDHSHPTQNNMSYNDNYDLTYSRHYVDPTFTDSYEAVELNALPNNVSTSQSYPPAAYQIEPQQQHDAMDFSDSETTGQLMRMSNDYDHHQYGAHVKTEEYGGYRSPYSDLTRASTPHDSSAGEELHIDKEQPYAQLIYHALMGAPQKTMILRDIYDWFKNNTDKAAGSETKGWQNSIRHNLSMNGAFEKVDQPCEDSRKGFMWRLTEEAIREGVKSTTRYRSKQPNKRSHRAHHPLPQRQASGAKGGQAARRSAKFRRSHRMQDAYQSRSIPAAFDPIYNSSNTKMPCPSTPYYGDEVQITYPVRNENLGGPISGSHLGMFSPSRSYMGSPLSHGLPITDAALMVDHSPNGSLYTNSPSSSADSPPTPDSHSAWNDDLGLGAPCVFDELAYREYAG